jgi:hypothetical protein
MGVPSFDFFSRKKLSKGGWARGNPAHCEVIAGLATIKPRAVYIETVVDKGVSECSIS